MFCPVRLRLKNALFFGFVCLSFILPWAGVLASSVVLSPHEQALLDRIERTFQEVRSMRAHFRQENQDGSVQTGTVALQRPGKMNLTYDRPSRVRVVADGVWLVFIDDSVDQVTNFPLNSSPASLLLRDRLRFDDPSLALKRISLAPNQVEIALTLAEEPDAGLLTLIFEGTPPRLYRWRVQDAAGVETTVSLSDIETGISLDPALFAWTNLPKAYR